MQQIINAVLDDYKKQLGANDLDITKINEYLMSYLNSQEAKNILTQEMTSIIQSTNIETQISNYVSIYAIIYAKFIILSTKRYSKKYDVYELINGKCFSI